jgi:hypothetical protein
MIKYQPDKKIRSMQYMNKLHGLSIIETPYKQCTYCLYENNEVIKNFKQWEVSKILSGDLDYTQYFNERELSTRRLDRALMGRTKTLGFVPPNGFAENFS